MKIAIDIHGTAPTQIKMFRFYCPGCKHDHVFNERWKFNGDTDHKPTFTPSLLCWHDGDKPNGIAPFRCHLFVTDGKIQFLSDCTHELKGKTVDIEDRKPAS